MCRKKGHKTQAHAAIARTKIIKNSGLKTYAGYVTYCCPRCKLWHVGTGRKPIHKLNRVMAIFDKIDREKNDQNN